MFKEVQSLETDTTIALGGVNRKTGKKNPTSVEGYYIGSKKVDSKKAKFGFAYLHVIQTAKGNIGVWGKTDLDRKILSATVGSMIRATHTGMLATPNGEMYKYKVEIDADNTIEVDLASSTANEPESSDDGTTYSQASSEDVDDEETDEEVENEDEVQDARAAALERAAKVQALLKGKGKKVS